MSKDVSDMKAFRFRESFRGYNKDDVNAYIQQQSLSFSQKEAELRAYIAELETGRYATATAPAVDSAELEALRTRIAELETENKRLADTLATRPDKAAAEADEEKSKMYDSVSAQVGNILIVANANAEKILSDAKAEAERILKEAEELRCRKIAELEAKLRMASEECMASYTALFREAQQRFDAINDTAKARTVELLVRAEDACADIERKTISQYGTTDNQ